MDRVTEVGHTPVVVLQSEQCLQYQLIYSSSSIDLKSLEYFTFHNPVSRLSFTRPS